MRWLSPVLLVSLGLHAMALWLPIPSEPEPPEVPESELLEPIRVSTLPVGSLPSKAQLEPDPAPLPASPKPPALPPVLAPTPEAVPFSEAPPPQPAPAVEAPPPVENPPLAEDLPPEDLPPEDLPPEDLPPEGELPPEKDPPPEKNPPSEQSPEEYSAEGTSSRDLASLGEFSEAIVDFAPDGPKFLVGKIYALEYTGDRCYQDETALSGAVGVLIDKVGDLQESRVITSTGYTSMNEALGRWFVETKGESPSEPSELQPTEGGLYGWLLDNHSGDWFVDVDYEAYYFQVEIELTNNSC